MTKATELWAAFEAIHLGVPLPTQRPAGALPAGRSRGVRGSGSKSGGGAKQLEQGTKRARQAQAQPQPEEGPTGRHLQEAAAVAPGGSEPENEDAERGVAAGRPGSKKGVGNAQPGACNSKGLASASAMFKKPRQVPPASASAAAAAVAGGGIAASKATRAGRATAPTLSASDDEAVEGEVAAKRGSASAVPAAARLSLRASKASGSALTPSGDTAAPILAGHQVSPSPDQGGGSSGRRIPTRLLPWSCPRCTLQNDVAAKKCGACKLRRELVVSGSWRQEPAPRQGEQALLVPQAGAGAAQKKPNAVIKEGRMPKLGLAAAGTVAATPTPAAAVATAAAAVAGKKGAGGAAVKRRLSSLLLPEVPGAQRTPLASTAGGAAAAAPPSSEVLRDPAAAVPKKRSKAAAAATAVAPSPLSTSSRWSSASGWCLVGSGLNDADKVGGEWEGGGWVTGWPRSQRCRQTGWENGWVMVVPRSCCTSGSPPCHPPLPCPHPLGPPQAAGAAVGGQGHTGQMALRSVNPSDPRGVPRRREPPRPPHRQVPDGPCQRGWTGGGGGRARGGCWMPYPMGLLGRGRRVW